MYVSNLLTQNTTIKTATYGLGLKGTHVTRIEVQLTLAVPSVCLAQLQLKQYPESLVAKSLATTKDLFIRLKPREEISQEFGQDGPELGSI